MSQMMLSCPHCSQEVLGDTEYAGQTLACPNCGGEFVMPGEPAAAPQQQAAAPPRIKRQGRAPQLNRPGIAVRQAPPSSSTGTRSSQLTPSSLQRPATSQQIATTSGLLYQSRPGFGRLFSDPVTGQRDACDGMGPGKSFLLGIVFLIVNTLVGWFAVYFALRQFSMALAGMMGDVASSPDSTDAGTKFHLTTIVSFLGTFVAFPFIIWLLRLIGGKTGKFGEILVAFQIAALWFVVFALVAAIGIRIHSIVFILGFLFAYALFLPMIWGTFRNLCSCGPGAAFWFTPLTVFMGYLCAEGLVKLCMSIF